MELNVLYADIDIKKYRVGQTIPNMYPGGFKLDLFKFWYQRSLDVSDEARLPNTSETITKINTPFLLFSKLSLSKKSTYCAKKITKKIRAFRPSFYIDIKSYKC